MERANKLVVEARLKGAGMHWARGHVDPLVALRNVICADRWAEAWPQIAAALRRRDAARRRAKRHARRAAPALAPTPPAPTVAPAADPAGALAIPTDRHDTAPRAALPAAPRRPATRHPWRRYRPPATGA